MSKKVNTSSGGEASDERINVEVGCLNPYTIQPEAVKPGTAQEIRLDHWFMDTFPTMSEPLVADTTAGGEVAKLVLHSRKVLGIFAISPTLVEQTILSIGSARKRGGGLWCSSRSIMVRRGTL